MRFVRFRLDRRLVVFAVERDDDRIRLRTFDFGRLGLNIASRVKRSGKRHDDRPLERFCFEFGSAVESDELQLSPSNSSLTHWPSLVCNDDSLSIDYQSVSLVLPRASGAEREEEEEVPMKQLSRCVAVERL